jgi:hypothetical protein
LEQEYTGPLDFPDDSASEVLEKLLAGILGKLLIITTAVCLRERVEILANF